MSNSAPTTVVNAVFKKSDPMPTETEIAKGYNFDAGLDYEALMHSYSRIGYQASHFGQAVDIVNQMIEWNEDGTKCKIFLGYTSNLVSSGLREIIRYLVKHKMV
jgi:deoxyhypusine synthase